MTGHITNFVLKETMKNNDELTIAQRRVEYWREQMNKSITWMAFYCQEWNFAKDELNRLKQKQLIQEQEQ